MKGKLDLEKDIKSWLKKVISVDISSFAKASNLSITKKKLMIYLN